MTAMKHIAIIGGGPAGLMAAQTIAERSQGKSVQIDLFDAMPSVGRKFLLAGRGGLNLTHAEPIEAFTTRYFERAADVAAWLAALNPSDVRAWAQTLGIDTFVGSSQRVFPTDMKAAPLLRAWLSHLKGLGVRFHSRHRLTGISPDGELSLAHAAGDLRLRPDATVLALGGASWQRLGSDGAWVTWLGELGADITPLQSANCGFDCATPWSEHLRTQFAGQPLKSVAIQFDHGPKHVFSRIGECVLTDTGIEGSLVYACANLIRQQINESGEATVNFDLLPAKTLEQVHREVAHPRGSRSLSAHLKSRLNLHGIKVALLHELLTPEQLKSPSQLSAAIKALPIKLARARPIDEAISSAGGVRFECLSAQLQLKPINSIFCAGEMLDWEAPTGGYLLTGAMASGKVAGLGVLAFCGV